ncbi:hypothetical protein B0H14DRAFT_3520159 [Mycena olivaceomarginata]|nr:hypothetical protein B0H14DRAFT_3520159 [Mycena olivaceomarginata]
MSPRASQSHTVNHMNIYGGVGGKGGAGGEKGGGGGAGEGASINYAVEAENFTIFIAQDRSDNNKQIYQNSNNPKLLWHLSDVLLPPRYSRVGKIFLKKWQSTSPRTLAKDTHMSSMLGWLRKNTDSSEIP